MLIQEIIEHQAILEGGIHALSMKREDGVSGIAEEQDATGNVPGGAMDCAELPQRVMGKFVDEIWHERYGVREFTRAKLLYARRRCERAEARLSRARQKQSSREAAVDVG